jgi:hypothetical protein
MTYAGATTRTPVEDGLALDDRAWAWQPKIDGCYAEIITDPAGRIAAVTSRNGEPLRAGADLIGIAAGPPRSIFAGELEAHTEAGIVAARRRGWPALHLFDCLAFNGASLCGAAYECRYAAIAAAHYCVTAAGRDHVESWTEFGPANNRRPRDPVTGRTMPRSACRPRDLRRLPIVPLVRGRLAARELWDSFVEDPAVQGEGLVAVALDAPAGARASKRKIKLTDTIDGRITAVSRAGDRRIASIAWAGGTSPVGWSSPPAPFVVQTMRPMQVGAIVEIAHDGWYATGVPRFPRVVRRRKDKTMVGAA